MAQTATSRQRRRRPGKVAARVVRLVGEGRRLLAIRADITAVFEAELAALRGDYTAQVARIDAQLRDLDHGLAPAPLRDEDDDTPGVNGRTTTQLNGRVPPC